MVTKTGTSGSDSLVGTASADMLNGVDGNDRLYGGNSGDRLVGGAGNDSLYGGFGNDTLGGSDGHDTLTGGEGSDLLWGGGGTDPGRDVFFGGNGSDTLFGDFGDDSLTAGADTDTLFGGGHNDTLAGNLGNDSIDGGDGTDRAVFSGNFASYIITYGGGIATVLGADGTDRVANVEFLEFGDRTVAFGPPPPPPPPSGFSIGGTEGNDTLSGQSGNDTIFGGNGKDTLSGVDGNDTLLGHLANDWLVGGNGNDSLFGGSQTDDMYGGAGNDMLSGDNNNDRLYGGIGDDRLNGGFGNDTINGGEGDDTVVLSGRQAAYTIASSGGQVIATGPSGSQTLTNVEYLQFDDTIIPVNSADGPPSAPVDDDSNGNSVAEGAATGSTVGLTASSTDAEGPVTYSLVNSNGAFAINSSSGVVTVANGALLDYENATSATITVRATDSAGQFRDQSFVVAVTNVAEPLTSITDADSDANTVVAGAPTGTSAQITARATDPDGGTVVYSLTNNADGRFSINTTTGEVTVADSTALTTGDYQITVKAQVGGDFKEQVFTIGVIAGNTPPGPIQDNDSGNNTVAENAAAGAVVGITASSQDTDTITYSLTDDAGGRFAINSQTGVVTVAAGASINYETASSYKITVRASDGNQAVTQDFTIGVTNVDEAPTAPIDSNTAPNALTLSGLTNGATVGITASSSDPEGAAVSYALTQNPGNRFSIDASTGVVTITDISGLTAGTYRIGVTSTDATSNTSSASLFDIVVSGATGGPEFKISGKTSGDQDTSTEFDTGGNMVAALTGGGFVSVMRSGGWSDGPAGENHAEGIWARRYDGNSGAVGDWFKVDASDSNMDIEPAVAALSNGGFVVTYSSLEDSPASYDIRGRVYDVTAGGVSSVREFEVTAASGNQFASAVTGLTGGGFVVTYTATSSSQHDVFYRRYDSDGDALGAATKAHADSSLDQNFSTIASLQGGGFVMAWTNETGSGDLEVRAARYNSSGVKQGSEISVNTTSSDLQEYASIAGLKDGGFVVTWSSFGQSGDGGFGVFGQRFDVSGNKVGGEFHVNSTTAGTQTDSTVIGLSDGGFLVGWTSSTGDGAGKGNGVYAQRYDASGGAIGGEFRLNVTVNGSQSDPHLAELTSKDLVAMWTSPDSDFSEGVYGRSYDNFA
jgi:hypothetical protein